MSGESKESGLEKTNRYSVGCLCAIFGISLIIGAVVSLLTVPGMMWREWRAESWPSVKGVVETWNVEVESHTSEGHTTYDYYPYPSYVYRVGERFFKGYARNLADDEPTTKSYPSRESALSSLRNLPVGGEVEVYVDPENPYDAVLDRSHSQTWKLVLLLVLGVPVSAVFGIGTLHMTFAHRTRNILIGLCVLLGSSVLLRPYQGNAVDYNKPGDPLSEIPQTVRENKDIWKQYRPGDVVEDPKLLRQVLVGNRGKLRNVKKTVMFSREQRDVPFWERDAVVELIQIPDRKDGWKIKSITAPYYEL